MKKKKKKSEEQEEVSNEYENQVDHLFISHVLLFILMMMIYIDNGVVPNIPDVVMDNPFIDYEGLDTNFDLYELDIELDEV
jgi:hypothetical protein